MNLDDIEDYISKISVGYQNEIYFKWLISEVKKKNLPIKSSHCRTTHTACECVLDNMNKLEERVKELEKLPACDYRGVVEILQEENAQLKIENSYHADHTIYQGNCITCAEWEDTDRENTVLKKENQHISLTKLNDNKKLHNKIKSISSKYDTTITRQEKYIDRLQEENFKLKEMNEARSEQLDAARRANKVLHRILDKLKAELEISQKDVKQIMENWNDAVNQATGFKAALKIADDGLAKLAFYNQDILLETIKIRQKIKQALSDISGKGEK